MNNTISNFWQKNDESTTTNRIIKFTTNIICKYFPKIIRKPILKKTYKIVLIFSRFKKLIEQIYLNGYLIIGREKYSRDELQLLFFSKEKMDSYIENLFFCEKPEYKIIGKFYLWNIKKKSNNHLKKVDAVLIKSDMFFSQFFKKFGFFVIPEWVSMSLDISKSIEDIYSDFSNSAKRDFRKAKSYPYSYEISHDLDKLNLFYKKMYLPYSTTRYNQSAICVNFQTMRCLFETGYKLMLIKENKKYVSGLLFSNKKKIFTPKYMGIIDEAIPLIKEGLGATIYYLSIKLAKEEGSKYIDFGGTRSFLNDGVFRYKKKWGCKIVKADKMIFHNIFSFKICSNQLGIRNFLINNPFIIIKNNTYQEKHFNGKIESKKSI